LCIISFFSLLCLNLASISTTVLNNLLSAEEFFAPLPNIGERRPTPEEAFGEISSWNCRGRDQQLDKILEIIIPTELGEQSKRDTYYFQASPGVGKTFLLSQLYKKNFPSKWEDLKNNVFFLVADFNRGSVEKAKSLKQYFQHDSELFVLLRIYYVECIYQKETSWEYFLLTFFNRISSTENAKKYMKAKIREKAKEKIIVILVDEVMKIKSIEAGINGLEFARSCRSALCRFMDSLDLCHYVIFSSLSVEFMKEENKEESSGRGVKALCTLPLLSHEDTLDLLQENIKDCTFSTTEMRTGAVDVGLQERCFETLSTLSAGHGRSIEKIVATCKKGGSISFENLIQQATTTLAMKDNLHNLYLILKSILLGEPVSILATIGDETYISLVEKGVLINSFDGSEDSFIPSCPGVFLYVWSHLFKNTSEELCQNLQDILLLRVNFNRTIFEKLHSHWEMMIRSVRSGVFQRKPLREVYRITAKHNSNYNNPLMLCPVDAKSILKPVQYLPNAILSVDFNTIIIPVDETQTGWDRLIFYECFPSDNIAQSYILPVFIQNKFSKTDSTISLSIATVQAAVSHCNNFLSNYCKFNEKYPLIPRKKRHFNGDSNYQFVLIFVARQNYNKNTIAQPPTNVLFCFEEDLKRLYGPTLYQFVNDLVPGESLVVNSPPIIPETIPDGGGESEEKKDSEGSDVKNGDETTKRRRTKR